MSKWLEIVKLLPKGLSNWDKVLEGWENTARIVLKEKGYNTISDKDVEEVLRRRVICDNCPLNSINAKVSKEYKLLFGVNYTSGNPILHCSICSCPIIAKTASLSSNCGLEEYNEKHQENKQELKWKQWSQETTK